ncbi:MAG: hypothetical protein GX345_07325 [Clostridiales bacterium]|nr:hypothetical protein [Clostridiales bacterium]
MKFFKVLKSCLVLSLCIGLLLPLALVPAAASSKTYRIVNPYESVDWDSWGHYKANLHTHSTVSDGNDDFVDVIEEYYARDYDILAMTDHGVVNRGWNVTPSPLPILGFHMIFRRPVPLTQERYEEITTGADRGGRGMTDVPLGIELNAGVLKKNHINGFFVDYGHGDWGKENDFEGPIAAVDKLGGLTHINHPGDWLGSAKDIEIARDPKNVKFFADIIKKYPSCLGIEIINSHDSPTRHDRVLWDGLLESVIPTGRNVWGFANSDSHKMTEIDTGFEIFMMPENTVENVRTAMENGTFFAHGRIARPELGDSFRGQGQYPVVNRISVDHENAIISLEALHYDSIEWVAKGEIIATGSTINLHDHEDQIGRYVRAQLKGPGGICFTQAFITDDGSPAPEEEVENPLVKMWEDLIFKLKSLRIYVIVELIVKEIKKKL